MSRIDELILELSPHGVEHKTLGEIGTVVRGKRFVKNDMIEAGIPCIHYGEIYTKYEISASESFSFVSEERAKNLRFAQPGDVIIASAGETVEDIGKSVAWLGDSPIAIHDACYAFRGSMDPKFVSYFFASRAFRDQIRQSISSSKISSISTHNVAKARIPVPPIEVQREIVRILDQFTQLEAELEAELKAELDARRHQYEHYRRELLSFDSEIEWMTLSDITDYTNGKAHERLATPDGNIPMVTARFISRNGEANRFVRLEDVRTPANAGDTALVLSDLPNGRALARTFFVNRDNSYAINQRVARLRVKDVNQVAPRFLYYALNRNPGLLKYDNGADQTHLSKGQVTGLRFPVPPISEQLRIVGVLDAFDALVKDLNVGLTAELAARRKHYEYYRDKLLTFDEAVA